MKEWPLLKSALLTKYIVGHASKHVQREREYKASITRALFGQGEEVAMSDGGVVCLCLSVCPSSC